MFKNRSIVKDKWVSNCGKKLEARKKFLSSSSTSSSSSSASWRTC